jgi:protein-S-isoprenylcysteine O-methyltransferase Ste14
MTLFLKNLLFALIVPATAGLYLPFWIALHEPAATGLLPILGSVLLLAGIALYLWCQWDFAIHGRGTPAPVDPPKHLVVRGPFRWVRNPMYLAVLLAITGWLLVFPMIALGLYALAVCAGFQAFVVLYEEPHLERVFGDEYRTYREHVGRWLPRQPRRG